MKSQLSLFGAPGRVPEGLAYRADFVSADEEAELIARLDALDFKPFAFRGFEGKRRTVSFGHHYDFNGGGLRRAEPIPAFLLALRERAAALAAVGPDQLQHALAIEYDAGAGIGWHRDRPVFGDVVGISLRSACTLRFRRRRKSGWERAMLPADPRSAYLLRGPARTEWEHSIAAVETLRYSITFRTLTPRAQL